MNFDQAFERLIKNEQGYVNNPKDPGGETNYGISKRSYPEEDIKNLTLERAKALYFRDFWWPARCDALPAVLRFDVFDFAVNSSPRGRPITAIKLLQQALGMPKEEQDGIVGNETLMAAQSIDPQKALRRFTGLRMRYYTTRNPDWWAEFGKGLMNRMANNLLEV